MRRLYLTAVAVTVVLTSLAVAAPQASAGDRCCPPPPMRVTLCVDDPCDPCPAI